MTDQAPLATTLATSPLMLGFAGERFDVLRIAALGDYRERPRVPMSHVITTSPQWSFAVLRRAECSADQADEIIRHWNGLPAGKQARCHTPGFALELLIAGECVFVAALCWKCDNISIGGPMATLHHREFESASIPASRLLKLCQQIAGSAG